MTRKDYVLLSDTMLKARPATSFYTREGFEIALNQWKADCIALAQALAQDNPRFDQERFLVACEVQE